MVEHSTQDISHKEAELLKIQREMQENVNSVKEKEHAVCLLESKCQQKNWQYQDMEKNLSELRSQCTQLQALLYRLEEKLSVSSLSLQETIVKELSEEAEKLRQILKENELSADEDKYLLNKVAEDCGHLTKENSLLHAQIQKVTKHLNQVGLICSSDSNLEKIKRNHKKNSLLHLQERKSTDHKRQHLHTQLIDLENQHTKVELENSKLRTEKNHWVEHISQIHKQRRVVGEKDAGL
ncbi:Mad1, partial [Ophiophagus hannah]